MMTQAMIEPVRTAGSILVSATRLVFRPGDPPDTPGGSLEENHHHGWLTVVDCKGRVRLRTSGATEVATFFRSSAKPFQALPLVLEGFSSDLSPEELALACASHTGSENHLQLARSILAKAGATEEMLQCGPHQPDDPVMRERIQSSGEHPSRLHNNCSGKHAAMLLYCRRAGLDPHSYLEPDHPLQRRILEGIRQWSGVSDIPLGVDGCGAPVFYLPLTAMAKLYAHLGTHADFEPLRSAMAAHPEIVGGHNHVDTAIIQASGGRLLAKVGADGVLCASRIATGEGLAFKLADGSGAIRDLALVEILSRLEWLDGPALKDERLTPFIRRKVRLNTQNRVVGHYRIHFDPAAAAPED